MNITEIDTMSRLSKKMVSDSDSLSRYCISSGRWLIKNHFQPEVGSLGIELEDVFGIKNPEGLMGQFLNEGSYTIDNEGVISTK